MEKGDRWRSADLATDVHLPPTAPPIPRRPGLDPGPRYLFSTREEAGSRVKPGMAKVGGAGFASCRFPLTVFCGEMRSRIFRVATAGLIALCSGTPAFACSVVIPPQSGPSQYRNMAEESVERSTAIIDGEVIQPFVEGRHNAVVRAVRVFKGPVQTLFEVGERDSCSLRLDRLGEHRRMFLVGGPKVYDLWNDGSNGRYEDRLLKSDRRKVWPYLSGQEPPFVAKD